MKKLSISDRLNASTLMLVSPEWSQVKAANTFETSNVTIPIETRTLGGRRIRPTESRPKDAPLIVLLSPFPESILTFAGALEALTAEFCV